MKRLVCLLMIALLIVAGCAKKDEEKKAEDQVVTEVDIQKHRNGAIGKVRLQFQKSINAFFNIDHSNH